MLVNPVASEESIDVTTTKPEGTGEPTNIVPGLFPEGLIVLV